MDERLDRLEARVDSLERLVGDLERRLADVSPEGGPLPETTGAPRERVAAPDAPERPAGAASSDDEAFDGVAITRLAGRTLVVLGGAFLLRALADSGTLSQGAAAALGLAFAAVWLFAADRAARLGDVIDATVHGATASAIAFPLLVETTLRFHTFAPAEAAGLLGLSMALGLAVAARRRLRLLGLGVTLAGLATAVALVFGTRALAPFVVEIGVLASVAAEISYRRDWPEVRRVQSAVLDAMLLVLFLAYAKGRLPWIDPASLIGLACGLAVFEIVFFLVGTLGRGWQARAFELGQLLVAVATAWWGGGFVAGRMGWPAWPFGTSALVLSAASWAVGLGIIERRQGRGVNASSVVALGLLFAFEGVRQLVPFDVAVSAWAALAVVAAWSGVRESRTTLRVGAGVLALAVGVTTGFGGLLAAIAGYPVPASPSLGVGLGVALCGAAYVALRGTRDPSPGGRSWTLPAFVLALVSAWGLPGFLGGGLAWVAPSLGADAGIMALVRTVLLVAAALGFALAHRVWSRPEFLWASWATLGLVGAKLAIDDLRQGRPATLFPALVLLGGALIFLPRFLRLRARAVASPPTDG